MNTATYTPYQHIQRRGNGLSRKGLALALLVSLLLHGGFVFIAQYWVVNRAQDIQREMETLFNVRLDQLQSTDFVSRPNSQQMREAREEALQRELNEMAALPERSVDAEMNAFTPSDIDGPQERWQDNTAPRFFDDQPASDVITSEVSQSSLSDLERNRSQQSVNEAVESPQKLAILGRGTGSGRRLIADLPPPSLDAEPSVERSAQIAMAPAAAPEPEPADASQPPITLPPVTELLPSPDLLDANPEPAPLQSEEDANEQWQEQYVTLDDLLQVDLITYRHAEGEGYFMLRIRPTRADSRLRILPKDLVLVVDASRSMGHRRLRAIKNEIEIILDRLRPEDRFNIVGFKGDPTLFVDTLAPVNQTTLGDAREFLSDLESSGHTNIYRSLEPLIELGTARARPLMLLLYSDGRPTVGVRNSRKIINNLTQYRGPSTSIFCIGTGNRINTYLLDMLAYLNRGLVTFEPQRENLDTASQSLFTYIQDPVLLRIHANFSNIDESEVFPKVLPELYMRGELNLWGRLENQDSITLRLVGEAFDEQKEMIQTIPIPARDNGTYEVAREWAYHKIYHLISRMVAEGETPERLEEIRQLSRTYNVVTPYSEQFGE